LVRGAAGGGGRAAAAPAASAAAGVGGAGAGRLGFVRVGLRWFLGRGRDEDLSELSARWARVESRRSALHVSADGEVLRLAPPLRYVIHPGALRVIAPRPAS
jgi:diacylglycerol kinase family enzyme